jgi:hypothetical protein
MDWFCQIEGYLARQFSSSRLQFRSAGLGRSDDANGLGLGFGSAIIIHSPQPQHVVAWDGLFAGVVSPMSTFIRHWFGKPLVLFEVVVGEPVTGTKQRGRSESKFLQSNHPCFPAWLPWVWTLEGGVAAQEHVASLVTLHCMWPFWAIT